MIKREQLRRSHPSEMKPGIYWYYKNDQGKFELVRNDTERKSPEWLAGFRQFIRKAHQEKRLFIREDAPGLKVSDEKNQKIINI